MVIDVHPEGRTLWARARRGFRLKPTHWTGPGWSAGRWESKHPVTGDWADWKDKPESEGGPTGAHDAHSLRHDRVYAAHPLDGTAQPRARRLMADWHYLLRNWATALTSIGLVLALTLVIGLASMRHLAAGLWHVGQGRVRRHTSD
jgi:hypothetical protein